MVYFKKYNLEEGGPLDIKEIGTGAVLVIGGIAYVSAGGLQDALSSDVKYITEVAYEDRAEYMGGIVLEFSEAFDVYIVQTETYDYVGHSKFTTAPSKGTFVEVVSSEEEIPTKEFPAIKAFLTTQMDFCAQEEMTIFTKKGWSYRFTAQDGRGRKIFTTVCRPTASQQNYKNKAIG